MDTQQADSSPQFPDDTPEQLRALTEPSYEEFVFSRLIRDVSGDALGGAVWIRADRKVRVMGYTDMWAVEAPPIERKTPDYASDDADKVPHIMECEMDAEFGLDREEAYELADAYMRGEAELTDIDQWVGENDTEQRGQQTLADIVTNE